MSLFHYCKTDLSDWVQVESLYLDAFPVNERQPLDTIKERIKLQICEFHIVKFEEKCIGFSILWNFSELGCLFLEYFAVLPNYRGQGIGKEFMLYMLKAAASMKSILLLEIEDPNEGDNREERLLRLKFYESLGLCKLTGVEYKLPPMNGSGPTNMWLLTSKKNSRDIIHLRNFVNAIYLKVYERDYTDKYLLQILNSIDE